jgi:hypothetical protein
VCEEKENYVRSEVFVVALITIKVFWYVTPHGLINRYQRFNSNIVFSSSRSKFKKSASLELVDPENGSTMLLQKVSNCLPVHTVLHTTQDLKGKVKAFQLHAWTGPWGSRRLRLQNF